MDDMDDDARYHPKFYSGNQHNSLHRRKAHSRNAPYSRPAPTRYEDVDDDDDDDLNEFDNGNNRQAHQEEEEEEEEDDDVTPRGPNRNFQAEPDFQRHPKKRKVKTLESSYEFAPRARAAAPAPVPAQQQYRAASSRGGGDEEWSEHAVFVMLEVWGDRFLQLGRKSLRSEDWQEVSQKVSEASKIERSELQCRAMLDVLKRKYKKEKAKMEQGLGSSKWAYFKKMEMLMASSLRQECGLACGVDSGEYVFMNTRVYLERSNGFDEMRDSPGESETDGDDDEEEDEDVMDAEEGSSYRVLADSIHKFGQIYEKIETSKRQQMKELEKMRKDFNKELELQKKQILETAQAEIAKIQESDDEETDVSVEDLSD